MASDGLTVCDRAEVRVLSSVFEDCGYNGGDCAHAWNEAVLSVEGCAFRFASYAVGIDDGAYVSVTGCTVHDLHFEALYCGKNSAHAEMEVVGNTVYGPLWWEQLAECDGLDATVMVHNTSRSRPGRVTERDNRVFERLPACLTQLMQVAGEAPPMSFNDPRLDEFVEDDELKMLRELAELEKRYQAQADP
jgi:hypothetical protein